MGTSHHRISGDSVPKLAAAGYKKETKPYS